MDNKRATLLIQTIEAAAEEDRNKDKISNGKNPTTVNNQNPDPAPPPGIRKAIEVAREHPNITIHSAELKAFFLWLESEQKDKGSWITLITRNALLQACPIVYPKEWREFQEFLQKNTIVFKTRSWKLS